MLTVIVWSLLIRLESQSRLHVRHRGESHSLQNTSATSSQDIHYCPYKLTLMTFANKFVGLLVKRTTRGAKG